MVLATAAGLVAGGAYLNAKYSIVSDIRNLIHLRQAGKDFAKAAAENHISLWYSFETQVKKLGDAECLWSREGCYSWRETHAMACRYAQFLRSKGVQRPDFVAFYMQNSPEFIFSLLASWALGTAPSMMNFSLGGEALIHCLKTSRSKVVLVDEDSEIQKRMEDVRDRVEGELGIRIVVLDKSTKEWIRGSNPIRPDDLFRAQVKPTDSMMMLFTSGTTGFPKGCDFDLQRTWLSIGTRNRAPGMEKGTRFHNCMPMYHGTGGVAAVVCLTSGFTLCIAKRFRVSTFIIDIRDSKATASVYVGETIRYLMASPPSPLDKQHNLRMVFGNGLRPDVWEPFKKRFGIEIVSEFFNSTEGVFSIINICRGPFLATCVGQHGLIARALTRNIYVPVPVSPVDNSIIRSPTTGFATRAPYSTGGEILVNVAGTSITESGFAGYVDAPEATAKKFVRDVFKPGDLYYRTGDALRRDDDGRWFFLDRLGDTFRWKSENVSTAEVGSVMGAFPGVQEANVYGVLLPRHDGRAGCAAVYIAPEVRASFDFRGFMTFLKARLPKYAVPVFLRVMEGGIGPSMHNNKQNKVPLREEGVDWEKVRGEKGASPTDTMYWAGPSGEYEPYDQGHWQQILDGRAKL